MESFLVYTAGVTFAVFLLYFIGVAIAPYKPDSVKNDHFECGLPASSDQPKRANYGFFVYAIMFIAADMTGLFFTLFVFDLKGHSALVAGLFALLMGGAITLAMRELQIHDKGLSR
ncbi:NADH-quinone oxidoreductase subunit A [Hydrogenimonas urashimensis]|uniref:NADH-quinone oxidoreductase subunit A n=1 Tax=Hydrogenimonas urashimensis TaxID=2740515 RepID=UPI0019165321|nr:NADH-quinone oxidoreductase subunit A [Hydrogenimonas urashimensis]